MRCRPFDRHLWLQSYDRTNIGAQTYTYNGLGDRVRVVKPTGTRHFVYDSQGRVVAEYGTSPNEVKAEFIWALPPAANDNSPFGGDDGIVGYAPLALVTTNTSSQLTLYWVHGNHLGVPIVTTNALGQVVDPGNDFLRPGFPGQSQVLSDLYYNRARDYDPVLGRYIQADPIGLLGGANLFLYANGDPVNMIDPLGENPIVAGIIIGAGVELLIQAFDNYSRGRRVFDYRCYEWGEVAFAGAIGAFGGGWIKGMVRMTPGKMHFSAVSKRIRRNNGLVGKQIDLHHWLIIQKMISRRPWLEKIANRPWNLNPVPRNFHQQVLNNSPYLLMAARGAPRPVQGAAVTSLVAGVTDISDGNLDD
jgi:RHS repeat-associated protein